MRNKVDCLSGTAQTAKYYCVTMFTLSFCINLITILGTTILLRI